MVIAGKYLISIYVGLESLTSCYRIHKSKYNEDPKELAKEAAKAAEKAEKAAKARSKGRIGLFGRKMSS